MFDDSHQKSLKGFWENVLLSWDQFNVVIFTGVVVVLYFLRHFVEMDTNDYEVLDRVIITMLVSAATAFFTYYIGGYLLLAQGISKLPRRKGLLVKFVSGAILLTVVFIAYKALNIDGVIVAVLGLVIGAWDARVALQFQLWLTSRLK